MAVQVGKHKGLTVIGTAGTPEGVENVRQCGADHVVNHRDPNAADMILVKTHVTQFVV